MQRNRNSRSCFGVWDASGCRARRLTGMVTTAMKKDVACLFQPIPLKASATGSMLNRPPTMGPSGAGSAAARHQRSSPTSRIGSTYHPGSPTFHWKLRLQSNRRNGSYLRMLRGSVRPLPIVWNPWAIAWFWSGWAPLSPGKMRNLM